MIRIKIRFLFFRNGISFKTIGDVMSAVTEEMTAPWNETTLPTLLLNYKLKIYLRLTSLVCLTNAHQLKRITRLEKNSKARRTGIAATSAAGEKLPMLAAGKSKIPRCFKNIKQFPCRYRSQKKSWIAGDLFEEWVRMLDSSFRAQDRKVVLLIDNFPAHPEIKNLTNINLIF